MGQAYASLAGVVILPYYFEFLGAESYGLVGFFVLLTSWLTLLTSAFAPALSREVAVRRGGGSLPDQQFQRLQRSIELLMLGIGTLTALSVYVASSWLAAEWLQLETLTVQEAAYAICLMGIIIGVRWGVMLYNSVLNGMEDQVWLNGSNIVFTTLRYGGAYVLLRWVSAEPGHFFELQVLVSCTELWVLARRTYAADQRLGVRAKVGLCLDMAALRKVAPFVGGIAYTSGLWVLTTQTDKLVLSHALSLEQYGRYALLIVLANGVLLIANPLTQAVLPRMTGLLAAGKRREMLALYRRSTGFLVVLAASAGGMLALFPDEILLVFSGSAEDAAWQAAVLGGYGLGNALLVMTQMQFLLQQAYGRLRLHVINSTIGAAIQVPVMVYLALYEGPAAVASGWLLLRLIAFLLWPALVHHRFAPGLHVRWLLTDVLRPLVGVATGLGVVYALLHMVHGPFGSRIAAAGGLAVGGMLCVTLAIAATTGLRQSAWSLVRQPIGGSGG